MFCILSPACSSKPDYIEMYESQPTRLLIALLDLALWLPFGNIYSIMTAQTEWKDIIWHEEIYLHLILNKFEGIGFLFMVHHLYLGGWFSYMQFYLFSSLEWKEYVKPSLEKDCTHSLKGFSCQMLCPGRRMKSA